MEFEELSKKIKQTFDTVATGYDHSALQFFPASAAHLCHYLAPQAGEKIVDVAAGTGNVTLAIAAAQPKAHITGIDFSDNMLEVARTKAAQAQLSNVEFANHALPQLDLPLNYFDAASCGFGIFFLEDMVAGMQAIRSTLKPEGRLVISSFYQGSFSPQTELFGQRLTRYGVEPPQQLWQRISTEAPLEQLFRASGFTNISTHVEDVSYQVEGVEQWWALLWNAGYRGLLNQLSEKQLTHFKKEHLAEIAQHISNGKLLITVKTLYGVGTKD